MCVAGRGRIRPLHRWGALVVLCALAAPLLGHPPAAALPALGAPPAPRDPSGSSTAVRYRPPVEGTVTDPFRAPATPYGPGNRGIDYATTPLSPVRAAADGEVVFAGRVAGALHLTLRHPDGLRTSYSFVAGASVHVGQRVVQGQVIGVTGEFFHFGVRDPAGTYLDPALLFAEPVAVHLVPGGDDGTQPDADASERASMRAVVAERLAPVARWLSTRARRAVSPADALQRLRAFAHYLDELDPQTHARRIAQGLTDWAAQSRRCTDAAVVPSRPPGRRILVEVAGIGSTSDQAAITGLDADGLGYAAVDVVRFSYRGGRVPGIAAGSPFAVVTSSAYDARDSQDDLRASAERLHDLLLQVAARAPGVPIDVVAHSQGGVVARLALGGASRATVPPEVQTLVTLGSPHQGTNAATAVDTIARDPAGELLLGQLQQAMGIPLDPALPAGRQLSQVSPVLDEMRDGALPEGVRFTSIGARGDLVVPAGRTVTGDARASETVVALTGVHAHDGLPAAPAVTREVALAVAGRPPTCRSLAQVTADLAVSDAISWDEDHAAVAAGGLLPGGPP